MLLQSLEASAQALKGKKMSDARFSDGKEQALKLLAQSIEDVQVFSTLCQDSIAERKDMIFESQRHSFSLLLKRFRWEDASHAEAQERGYERVQTVLAFETVLSVSYNGFEIDDPQLVFDLIGISAEANPASDADNFIIILTFSGNGQIKLIAEDIRALLQDVSRPYLAKSPHKPQHSE